MKLTRISVGVGTGVGVGVGVSVGSGVGEGVGEAVDSVAEVCISVEDVVDPSVFLHEEQLPHRSAAHKSSVKKRVFLSKIITSNEIRYQFNRPVLNRKHSFLSFVLH